MKILHLTDVHISRTSNHALPDTKSRLERCIESINRYHSDAELCVITGDLADDGSAESYADLRDMLAKLVVPVQLTIGNHDNRANFQSAFPSMPRDENGFTQCAFDLGRIRVIVLDTVLEGKIYGWMCEKRLRWLESELVRAGKKDTYIFMHHPAFPIGIRHHEKISLVQSEEFKEICTRHGCVRRIFAGHVHAEANIRAGDLYMSLSRGVSQHLLFEQWSPNATYISQDPSYNIILVDQSGEAVHYYDLMHEAQVVGTSALPPELEWNGSQQ